MTEEATEVPGESPRVEEPKLDPRRVRSFIGLVLGRLGPRAFGAVAGIFLALLIGEYTESLFWVTFALTVHRFVTWLFFPLAGRWSDRSETALGRRVPFMAGGLLIAGVCTALFTKAGSYWSLVGLIVVARLALVAYSVPSSAVTPETFGASRWARAGVAVSLAGLVLGLAIRGTAIATWDQSDPSTWGPAYYLAAAYIIFSGLIIAFFVREAPAAKKLRTKQKADIRETIRGIMAAPNAKILITSVLFSVAAGGAFDRVYPIYARDVLGSGGDSLAGGGIVTILLGILTFPASWILAGRLSRKTNAVLAGLTGGASALAHFWITDLWQSVAVGALSSVFLIAATISLAPLYLRLLPRGGGLGERIGLIMSPILIAGMLASYTTAIAYDLLAKNYDIVWGVTAVFAFAGGIVQLWLRVPEHSKHANPMGMWNSLRELLWGEGKNRHLFSGELTAHEADGAALLEVVADELNPYEQRY